MQTPPANQGTGRAPRIRQPDTFAQDPSLAAALAVESSQADSQQAAQNSQSPAMRRMAQPPAQTRATGTGSGDVWVTVPVDKVSVANGKGTVTPLYATADGYQSPDTGHEIPPVPPVGRPPT